MADRKEPQAIARRFWSKVEHSDSCWLWSGSRNQRGYGEISVRGRCRLAPRIAWELTRGAIPDGLFVLHRCDNPPCVNPEHLFLGTPQDNVLDMLAKGRGNPQSGDNSGARKHPECIRRGETSGMSKLNDDAVRLIRSEYAAGATVSALARRLNVARTTVRDIAYGRAWKHVE